MHTRCCMFMVPGAHVYFCKLILQMCTTVQHRETPRKLKIEISTHNDYIYMQLYNFTGYADTDIPRQTHSSTHTHIHLSLIHI